MYECVIIISAKGTTGGTASFGIFATFPVQPDNTSNQYAGGAQITDGGSTISGHYYVGASAFGFFKYDGTAWSLGSSRIIRRTITYEI